MPTFEDEDKGIAHYIPVMSGFEPSPYWATTIWKSVANPHTS